MNEHALTSPEHFQRPSALERLFNRLFGALVALGGGLAHNRVLEVEGRRSGKRYRTPVNLMALDGRSYLVAPRGRTAWVKNAEAAGEVTLQRGRRRQRHRLRALPVTERAPILQAYLQRYAPTVRGYFSVDVEAPRSAFEAVAARHPVFEVLDGH